MAGLSGFLTALNVAGNVANTIGTIAGAAKNVTGAFGGWGQTGNSQSSGGSAQQGGGHSASGSQAGTNIQQVNDWLKQAYAYQGQEAAMQGKYNSQSMLKQMGYNTLQAIMQGVYNHIENSVAMNYNSAEALANREWQEHMSNTAYQRAVEDMKKAGLNPILAFSNGGASTPGGSAGTISGASMGLASSSALGVSRSGGFVPNAYESSSWSQSDWYSAAQSWQQMLSTTHMTPYGLQKALTDVASGTEKAIDKATVKQPSKKNYIAPQDKTGKYGEKRKPGDYLK
ncbi:VP2 [Gokushovirus WZ-2015a]|nr:VP2 [Gokushovirus WZ-2015a]